MAVTFTIGGVAKTSQVDVDSLTISMNYRSTWTAEFSTRDLLSTAGAYRPALDDAVVIADGATTVFRGWVFSVDEEPIAPPRSGTRVRVSCRSYDTLLDAIIIDKVYGTDPLVIANSSIANPASITTVQPHGYVTGQRVVISDHVGGVAGVNGTHVVTVTSHSTFTIPVNNTSSGGGGTVRQVMAADVVMADLHATYLNSRGVSLDTLSTGADLSKQVFKGVTLRAVVDHLCQVTGWVCRITPAPQLQFFAAGAKTASYSLTAANGLNIGPVIYGQRRQRFVNRVVLRFGSEGVKAKTDTITGDGATNVWALKYHPAVTALGYILSRGAVYENATTDYPLGLLSDIVSSSVANPTTITTAQPHGLDPASTHAVTIQSHTGSSPAISGAYTATVTGLRTFTIPVNVTVAGSGGSVYSYVFTWLYYPTTNSLFRVGALGSEVVATFEYSAQFPDTVTAVDGAGDWHGLFEAPDVYDSAAAQQLANGILRRELAKPKTVSTSTLQGFVMPGDTITLTYTDKTISGAHLIQNVTVGTVSDDPTPAGLQLLYTLSAVTGTEFKDSALDITRDALNGGGLSAAGGTISGSVVPAPSGVAVDNVLAKSGSLLEEVEIGAVTGGLINSAVTGVRMANTHRWVMGVRPKQSPGVGSGNEWVLFDTKLSASDPVLRLVDDTTNVILALNSTFTSIRGVQIGEDASGKRFASVNSLITRAQTAYYERGRSTPLGEWTTYAPTWAGSGSNPAIGNGSITGKYTQVGKTVFFKVRIVMGSTTTYGSGLWTLTLPVNAAEALRVAIGTVLCENVGLADYTGGVFHESDASKFYMQTNDNNFVTDAAPFAWGTSDFLTVNGFYEIA